MSRDAIKNVSTISTAFKKAGANFADKNAIRRLANEGLSAETISDELRIELKCVTAFMADKPTTSKAKKAEPVQAAPSEETAEDTGGNTPSKVGARARAARRRAKSTE